MSKLEKALYELNVMEQSAEQDSVLHRLDPRAKLVVTLLFLISVLSLPLENLSGLILFFVYPIISCSTAGIGYGILLKRSLVVLPFIVFIGIFNPIIDRQIVFYAGNLGITAGWISFFSILLRGLLSVQAVLILILSTGFYNLCRGMQRLGIPSLFTTQLLFVYRYIFVLLQEALSMDRARDSRSFGQKSYSFRMWGTFIGQLLIRTIERSERIHRAMLSRGFTGNITGNFQFTWKTGATIYLIIWSIVFLILRIFQPTDIIYALTNQ